MKRFSQLALPYIVWAVLMLVMPMALIAVYSIMEQGNSIIPFSFTLEHYIKFFTDPDFLLILWRSFAIAVKTTAICLLLGYPAAYFIARSSEKVQNGLILCITLPTWINMLVRTYAWIGMLSDGGMIQKFLSLVGLGDTKLLYTEGAVLLGMVYNFLPFMISRRWITRFWRQARILGRVRHRHFAESRFRCPCRGLLMVLHWYFCRQ